MSFSDNYSQWNKLDAKIQIANLTRANLQWLIVKQDKKTIETFIYFINQRLTVSLATKVCHVKPKYLMAYQQSTVLSQQFCLNWNKRCHFWSNLYDK